VWDLPSVIICDDVANDPSDCLSPLTSAKSYFSKSRYSTRYFPANIPWPMTPWAPHRAYHHCSPSHSLLQQPPCIPPSISPFVLHRPEGHHRVAPPRHSSDCPPSVIRSHPQSTYLHHDAVHRQCLCELLRECRLSPLLLRQNPELPTMHGTMQRARR